jgi:voltage-gated potassium channel
MKSKKTRFQRFFKDISLHTPFTAMLLLLIVLWLIFSTGMFFSELNAKGSSIGSYGDALYWGALHLAPQELLIRRYLMRPD